jgi:hypothetical protein
MKSEKVFLSLLLVVLVGSVGCGSLDPETGRTSLGYVPARFYDLLDILQLNLAMDSTFSFYAVAGLDPIYGGLGLYEAEKLGWDGRLFGQWTEKRCDLGLGLETFTRYEKIPNWGNRYLFNAAYSPHKNTVSDHGKFYDRWGFTTRYLDHEHRILDVSAEVHVFAFGVDVGVSPLEILDFATGILGFDVISDDDWVDPAPARRVPMFGEKKEKERTGGVESAEGE